MAGLEDSTRLTMRLAHVAVGGEGEVAENAAGEDADDVDGHEAAAAEWETHEEVEKEQEKHDPGHDQGADAHLFFHYPTSGRGHERVRASLEGQSLADHRSCLDRGL